MSQRKYSSLENNKNNKNSKQCEKIQDRNVDKNKTKETNKQFPCKSGSSVIVADSIVNGINEKRLSKKRSNVKVFHFLGARIEDINQYIIPIT